MRKKVELILLILLLAGLVAVSRNLGEYVSSGKVKLTKKKDINLQVAKRVKKLLEDKGVKVIMTREKDQMLSEGSTGSKKVQDMKERVKLINDTAPDLAVSIHQNSYSGEEVHGAQVFYYTHSTDGEKLAEIMQKALLSVDRDNHRKAKADSTYYLLRRTEVPTIIVECGFLSNYEEAEKLVDEKYQKQLAKAIVKGIESCLAD